MVPLLLPSHAPFLRSLVSLSPPLPHLWDLCQGGSVPGTWHRCHPEALAAAVGRPARPPDHAGPGGPHVPSRVPAVSVPVPRVAHARLSGWAWKGVQSDWDQEGCGLCLLPLCLCQACCPCCWSGGADELGWLGHHPAWQGETWRGPGVQECQVCGTGILGTLARPRQD